jgi:hypothetical protein
MDSNPPNKKRSADPDPPAKSLSAYQAYFKDTFRLIKKDHPDKPTKVNSVFDSGALSSIPHCVPSYHPIHLQKRRFSSRVSSRDVRGIINVDI